MLWVVRMWHNSPVIPDRDVPLMNPTHSQIRTLNAASMRGFSMVELLVAVLIMGVGVLGVASLRLVSLQNSRNALLRSDALQMVYGIVDRIRINPAGDYTSVYFDDAPESIAQNCFANSCSAAQMAAFDVSVWKCSLGRHNTLSVCEDLRTGMILPSAAVQPGLPEGDGSIAVDDQGRVSVSVRWAGHNGALETLTIETQR